jgi:hypothetical protein
MRWLQIRKRDQDVERELQSDLELEEEEHVHTACRPERLAGPPCVRSVIPLSFAIKLARSGVGTGWRIFFAI